MKTITNLENALKFAVNIYEIENSILNGDTSYKTHYDHEEDRVIFQYGTYNGKIQ